MASPFIKAMNVAATGGSSSRPSEKRLGENGSPEFTEDGVNDLRVGLFFALVRDAPDERIKSMMDKLLVEGQKDAAEMIVADVFVLAMQTRNCRGGKGERDLFYTMLLHLRKSYPETVKALIRLVPHYGSYKDWFRLASLSNDEKMTNFILSLAAEQLKEDSVQASITGNNTKHVSLLAKWAPREKREYDRFVGPLARLLFPASKTPKKDYRQLVASLNKVTLQTTETKMTSQQWDKINFGAVPSNCLMKFRKAFLNEKVGSPPSHAEDETGNRYPDNPDRVACRKRLRQTLTVKKLKGRQLFPHEITKKLRKTGALSTVEKDLLEAQWNDVIKSVKEAMEEQMSQKADEDDNNNEDTGGGGVSASLGKLVPLVDVSGSMIGEPMEVAIALGILVSQLNDEAFQDHFLTFESKPNWVSFREDMSLAEKVQTTGQAGWGGCTNFVAALEQILDVAQRSKLSPDEIPNLIVFSDMQFDQANSGCRSSMLGRVDPSSMLGGVDFWETQHERLVRRFHEVGVRVCGRPWPVPHIIYWNLRGNTGGFPAQKDTEGVTMLSGYSPALLKLLLSGKDLESEVVTTETNEDGEEVVVVSKKKKDPYDTLRAALDDPAYDKVRMVLGESTEGVLKDYVFEPKEELEGDAVLVGTNETNDGNEEEEEWVMED